jgi:hypothetical protein
MDEERKEEATDLTQRARRIGGIIRGRGRPCERCGCGGR